MKRFILLLIIAGFVYVSWGNSENNDLNLLVDKITSQFNSASDQFNLDETIDTVGNRLKELTGQLDPSLLQLQETDSESVPVQVAKPELEKPAEQVFSIHNLEIGTTMQEVKQTMGEPNRVSTNEYGGQWHTFHDNYQNFLMVSYDSNNRVSGLFTNQDLISSKNGVQYGAPKETVIAELGEPVARIQKGLVYYQLQEDRDYDVFLIDGNYITVFYDKHQNNTVTALQIHTKEMEQNKQDFYAEASQTLKEGFEYQLFDLTNSARVKHGKPVLGWDDHVRGTARKHSQDMAENNYFSHTNLQGQSPFDRMEEDQISFSVAGENLAYGQFSGIFAHEGLMNSMGHRENILKADYKLLGVGVAFNTKSQPYFTAKFYTKRRI
ncbi:CAP domain-containing protein [Mesobacillus harenae]|uniref:CAP domain-containing protein n=1 Tax=Mesobacillus harenae TaxID=2213203 RepID=UPI0015812877|nr:CAP domain-containing protein [Mesobacillus harenae]